MRIGYLILPKGIPWTGGATCPQVQPAHMPAGAICLVAVSRVGIKVFCDQLGIQLESALRDVLLTRGQALEYFDSSVVSTTESNFDWFKSELCLAENYIVAVQVLDCIERHRSGYLCMVDGDFGLYELTWL